MQATRVLTEVGCALQEAGRVVWQRWQFSTCLAQARSAWWPWQELQLAVFTFFSEA
jgi:hypothetical protein